MIVILGAGLAGLSTSCHIGHDKCLLLEKRSTAFGASSSLQRQGFTWDMGPHISFTRNQHVRDIFKKSVQGQYEEFPVQTVNYYQGHWIDHPAQSNFYQIPQPLRTQCLESFRQTRNKTEQTASEVNENSNYGDWLERAYGPVFAHQFPFVYTHKFWTIEAKNLTSDWVGSRMYYPSVDDVEQGAKGPLPKQTHYIKKVRYPSKGGYQSFAKSLFDHAQIEYDADVKQIDLKNREVITTSGKRFQFSRLINTLPLPLFVEKCLQSTEEVRLAAKALSCSDLLLVNVMVPHPKPIQGDWFYVYDSDKISTRIHCVETMSAQNAPAGHTGIQVEVYASKYRKFTDSHDLIRQQVINELIEMGFINADIAAKYKSADPQSGISSFVHHLPWANVIFDTQRRESLNTILDWLSQYGLERQSDDLQPCTDWDITLDQKSIASKARIFLSGRFGQWKYFWSDDCVLRGKDIAQRIGNAR